MQQKLKLTNHLVLRNVAPFTVNAKFENRKTYGSKYLEKHLANIK